MELYGSLEVKEEINLPIHLMELHGLEPVRMRFLQVPVMRSHGTELYGLLEVKEQIALRIRLTESNGLRPLLEMKYLHNTV
jgi:hypothetical protein